jgi:hypothetical protein
MVVKLKKASLSPSSGFSTDIFSPTWIRQDQETLPREEPAVVKKKI